jgi:hypothetical protein
VIEPEEKNKETCLAFVKEWGESFFLPVGANFLGWNVVAFLPKTFLFLR